MKKFLRIVSLMLVMAMLLPMTPIEVFATETENEQVESNNNAQSSSNVEYGELGEEYATSTHDTSLTELKQDIYSTGLNAYKVNEGDIDATDGVIDDEYVKVTPDAVDHGPSYTYMQYTSNKGWNGQSILEIRNDWDAYAALLPDINYYVAQSDSHIYLVVKEDVPYIAEGVTVTGTESKVYSMNDWGYWFYRLGFNPNDYTQQICIDNNAKSWFTASWIADNNNKYDISSAGVMTSWARANTNYADPRTQAWSRVSEIKLSKEAIKSVYSTNFGVTLTDEDLATMFIAVSCQLYARRDNDYSETSSETNDRIGNPIYGVFTAESVASSENNVIPDVIVFGNEKSGPAFASCSFTGHSTEARYLVEGTTDTYYHACTHCGMAGASTFKVVDDALVYDKQIPYNAETVTPDFDGDITGDCLNDGTYLYTCSCGKPDTDTTHTYTVVGDGHNFTAEIVASKYLKKAATCSAGAIYYKSCVDCGTSSKGDAGEATFIYGSPLRWASGTPNFGTDFSDPYYVDSNGAALDLDQQLAIVENARVPEGFNWGKSTWTVTNYTYTSSGTHSGVSLSKNDGTTGDSGIVGLKHVDNLIKESHSVSGSISSTNVTLAASPVSGVLPDFEHDYFVGYDDEYIYLTVREILTPVTYVTDEATGATATRWILRTQFITRIGINPNDYSQLMMPTTLRNNYGDIWGVTAPTGTDENGYAKADDDLLLNGNGRLTSGAYYPKQDGLFPIADMKVAKYLYKDAATMEASLGKEAELIASGNFKGTAYDYNYNASLSKPATTMYISYKIDKEDLAKAWDNAFGTTFAKDGLPNTLFVVSGGSSYVREATDTALGNHCTLNNGTALTTSLISGKTYRVFPNVIVYGDDNEKNDVVAPGCNFTAHNTAERYLVSRTVEEGDGVATFYHSCTECGSAGARRFTANYTYDSETQTYSYDVVSSYKLENPYDVTLTESTEDYAVTCETAGEYYRSCDCGAIGVFEDNENALYTEPATGHDEATKKFVTSETEHWFSCKNCESFATEKNEKTEHTLSDNFLADDNEDGYPDNIDPENKGDCENAPTYFKICSVCNYQSATETFTTGTSGHKFTEETVAEGLLRTEATCTVDATYWLSCANCEKSVMDIEEYETVYADYYFTKTGSSAEHKEANCDYYPAKEPTCIAIGWDEYYTCSVCGYENMVNEKAPLRYAKDAAQDDLLDFASLIDYGQQIHWAGASASIDGDIEWVIDDAEKGVPQLVYNAVAMPVSNKYVASHYAGNYQSTKTGSYGDYYNNAPLASQDDIVKVPDTTYYAIEDDDSYIITFRMFPKTWGDDPENPQFFKHINYFFRLGFNPNDYTQAVVLKCGANSAGASVVGFSDSDNVKIVDGGSSWLVKSKYAGSLITDGVEESGIYFGANYTGRNVPYVGYMTIEIDKAEIAKAWDAVYGTDFYNDNGTPDNTEDDTFALSNTIFACSSNSTNGATDDTSLYFTSGAVSVPKEISGTEWGAYCTLVPDVIVIGEEKDTIAAPGCNFTGHVADEKYLVPGTTNTYYHSCTNVNVVDGVEVVCGAAGARTFTLVDDSYYTAERTDIADAVITAATCYTAGEYVKHCNCGELDPEGGTITIGPLGHIGTPTFEYDADGHWLVCERCDTEGAVLPTGSTRTPHTYDLSKVIDLDEDGVADNLIEAATCTTRSSYYKICECNAIAPERGDEDAYVFEAGELGHKFDDKTTNTHKKSDATCTANAVYFVECSVCHATSEGTGSEETYEIDGSMAEHIAANQKIEPAKEPTCIAFGWEAHIKCDVCGYSELEANKIDPIRWTSGSVADVTLDTYRNAGSKVYSVVGAYKTPTVDGFANLSEYTTYGELAPTGFANNITQDLSISSTFSSNPLDTKGNLSAEEMKAILDGSKVRYMLAEDGDNYYIAIQKISGATEGHVVTRNRWFFTFAFDPNNPNTKFTLDVIGQGGSGWTNDTTNGARVRDFTLTYGGPSGDYNLSTSKYNTIITEMMGTARVTATPKVPSTNYDDFVKSPSMNHGNGWFKHSVLATMEMTISKDGIRDYLGLAEDAELPDTFLFSLSINDQIVPTSSAYEATTTSADGNMYVFWNGAINTDATNEGLFKESFIGDIYVFEDEMKLGCNFTGHETRHSAGTDEEGNELYYHYCIDCGAVGARIFKIVDGSYYTANNIEAEGATVTAVTCESAGTYIKNCTCGELDPEGNTFTVEALGHSGDVTTEKDAEGHWLVCERCDTEGAVLPTGGNKTPHEYSIEEVIDLDGVEGADNLISNGSCSTLPTYLKICSCFAIAPDRGTDDVNVFEYGELGHTGENERVIKDAEGHWTVCDDCYIDDTTVPEGNEKVTHVIDKENASLDGVEISAPNCTDKGVYRLSCECGYFDPNDDTNVFYIDELGHTFNDKTTKTHKNNDATCLLNERYFVECSVCHASSKGTPSEELYEIEGTMAAHIAANQQTVGAKAPTCIAVGWNEYVKCDVCGHSTYEENKIAPTRWKEGIENPAYFGQRTFYVLDDCTVNDADIKLNAAGVWEPIEEGFVKVNSEPLKATITSKLYSNKGLNQTGVTITAPEDFEMYPITPTFDYYVAKSDTTIYIVFDMIYHPDENGIGTNATKNVWTSDYYKYFRLGFNPEDYTQQVIVATRGHGLANDSQKGFFYVSDVDSATQLWTGYNYDSPYYDYAICGQGNSQTVTNHRIRKYAFNIEDMKELYLEQFGVTLTDEDFNSFFVAGSHHFRENGTVSGDEKTFYATYGTVLPTGDTEIGLTTLLPDRIVFGSAAYEDPRCDYTGHSTDPIYYVGDTETGDKLYVHSCKDCGAPGANLFKVSSADGTTVIYDHKNTTSANTTVTAVTCETAGEYYYSCICGELHPDEETFTVDALGHKEDVRFEVTETEHWRVCSRCEEAGGGAKSSHAYTNETVLPDGDDEDALPDNVHFAGDCENVPTYYKVCECGKISTSEDDLFTPEGATAVHDWIGEAIVENLVDGKGATCTTDAVYYKHCTKCDVVSDTETWVDETSSETHEANSVKETDSNKAPTCIAIGYDTYSRCTECGHVVITGKKEPTRWPEGTVAPVQLGQKFYLITGDSYKTLEGYIDMTPSSAQWQDLEEGEWTKINDQPITPTFLNQRINTIPTVAGTTVSDTSTYAELTPDYDFYIAESDETIYVAFDQMFKNYTTGINGMSTVVTWRPAYYRIGFNPADPTQQLVVMFEGFGLHNDTHSISVYAATATGSTLIYNGLVKDFTLFKYIAGGSSVGNAFGGHLTRKFAFDKEMIKQIWQDNYDVTLTDEDLDTVHLAVSHYYSGDIKVNDTWVNWYAAYGTVLDSATATQYGVPNILPVTVMLGNGGGADDARCDYTAHTQNPEYLVSDVDGIKTYLHSCSECGAPSSKTFRVDSNGELVYDVKNTTLDGALKTAPDCDSEGEYYYSNCCGELHPTETFTVEALGHKWVDHDDNFMTARQCEVCQTNDNDVYTTDNPEDVLNILMIGNSFCTYYPQELYGLAAAAGYKDVNIVSLYESGCPVKDHWTWLNDDSAAYALYITNAKTISNTNGRQVINNVTVKYALGYAKETWGVDWDIITFQQHFYPTLSANYDWALNRTRPYAKYLFDYVKENHPEAQFLWHETWPYQIGYGVESYYSQDIIDAENVPTESFGTLEQQITMYNTIKGVSNTIISDNGVNMVPAGDAWVIARRMLADAGMVDDLCARIGTNGNRGDYYHDGDIGGGQYLNACVWFEVLFGQSCIDNPYLPDYANVAYYSDNDEVNGTLYELTEEEMAILQQAAHEAVAIVYGPGYAGHKHIWVEATCTTPKYCASCDVVEGEALGHQNAQGESLTTYCVDAAEDRYCVRCKTTIYLVHEYGDDDTCDLCGKTRVSWTAPYGTNSYYATDISGNTPTIDGAIGNGEYGEAIVVTPALPTTNTSYGDKWETGEVDNTLASENMQYYFSYDADNIYVAIKDPAPALVDGVSQIYRSNYAFYFGFDLNNVTRYFYFAGGATDSVWVNLGAYDNGSKVADLATYDLISEAKIRRKNVTTGEFFDVGDFFSENGNQNCFDDDWELYIEFKMSKQDIIDMMNEVYTTDYTELSNAMWIGMNTTGYRKNPEASQYFRWLGRNNISGKKGQFTDYGLPETSNRDWLFDLVVFGEEGTVIEVANRYQPHDDCPDGHTLTTYEAKAPTNSAAGWKKYVACSVCGYTTYEEIPMIVDTFEMGYSRVVITPYGYFPIDGKTGVHIDDDGYVDDIYATVAAMYDGETTLLLISIDIGSISETMCDRMRRNINAVTGVPKDNIIIAATHSHSSVSFSKSAEWRSEAFANIANAAAEAIADLSETDIYIGEGKTTGMAWVRRYVNIDQNGEFVFAPEDHVWPTIDQYNDPTTTTVSEADDTVQIVRFVRADKKDIVATNWQGHLASAVNDYPELISSDIANYMRKDIEKGDTDTQVIFIAGASGNLNLCAPNSTVDTYGSGAQASGDLFYERVAHALATETLRVLNEGLTQIESGKISMIKKTITVRQQNETDEEVAAAQARIDAAVAAGQEPSKVDRSIVARNVSDARTLRVMAVGIGDLGMVVVPYEMFDTNGMQIKEASPYKMTLVITNADGDYAYMPSYQGKVYYGGYDANNSYFRAGTAELLVETYVGMLEELSGPHTWSKWTINTLPTADAEGSATKTCSHCDSVVTVTLPKLDKYHLFEDLYGDADEPAYKSDGTTIFTDVTEIGTAACLYTINDSGIYVFKFADGTTALMTLEYVSVDITWGTMSFIYTNCMWNPEDLEYNIGEWQPAEANANVITIYNSGTVNVNVTFIYVSEDAFADSIGGSFTGVDANGTVEVVAKENENITLELIRKAIPQKGENLSVGTVTITITEAEDAE